MFTNILLILSHILFCWFLCFNFLLTIISSNSCIWSVFFVRNVKKKNIPLHLFHYLSIQLILSSLNPIYCLLTLLSPFNNCPSLLSVISDCSHCGDIHMISPESFPFYLTLLVCFWRKGHMSHILFQHYWSYYSYNNISPDMTHILPARVKMTAQ